MPATYAYVVSEETDTSAHVISVHQTLKGAQGSGSAHVDNFNANQHPGIPPATPPTKWGKAADVKNRWEREVVSGTKVSVVRHKVQEN